jgi:putative hydrolase of HD superfamily
MHCARLFGMNQEYVQLLSFLGEAEKLKSTLRHNWMTSGRQEDSSQHSWRAALFFIIAHELFQFEGIDAYKTLVMLTIHDLPEATYGDIPAFAKDSDLAGHTQHKLREQQAARELYAKLPSPLAEKFTALQEEFEAGETPEAKLAQALEKIESQLQHQESGPKYWSDEERGDHMLHYPDKALAKLNNPDIQAIWQIIYDKIYAETYHDTTS